MSLALVQITVPVFQEIRDHILTIKPPYRNMHMRQRSTTGGLRYLHAMFAQGAVVEGMISGPGLFWHYRLSMLANTRVQVQLLDREIAPQRAASRIRRRFLPEISARMRQEREGSDHYPKLTPGQFYLRRGRGGMSDSHRNCVAAVSSRVLDQRFVSQLRAWDLLLLHP